MLEQVRLLAVLRLSEGWSQQEVAEFLGVSGRSVRRWHSGFRRHGEAGLAPRPGRGRPPKLTGTQAGRVLSWLGKSPAAFGFATERWTAPRLASVIADRLGVRLNHRYLNDWLRRRGVTPQVPQRQARERDQARIDAWVANEWPLIKKRPATCAPPSGSPTRAGSCWRR